ncbi:MAG TPA: hypothetical protein VJB35_06455 [Candidatus Nanoarchaeia archaeon]|nr:hypothetical protein [Candidatus Nanoarchaeia archaeon]
MEQITLETINNKLDFLIEREMQHSNEILSPEAEEAIRIGMQEYRERKTISREKLWEELRKKREKNEN